MSDLKEHQSISEWEIARLLRTFAHATGAENATVISEPHNDPRRRAEFFVIDAGNKESNETIAFHLDELKIPFGCTEPNHSIHIFSQDLLFDPKNGHTHLQKLQAFANEAQKPNNWLFRMTKKLGLRPNSDATHITFEALPNSALYSDQSYGKKPQGPNGIKVKLARELGGNWTVTDSRPEAKKIFAVNHAQDPYRASVTYGENGCITLNAVLDTQYADALKMYLDSERMQIYFNQHHACIDIRLGKEHDHAVDQPDAAQDQLCKKMNLERFQGVKEVSLTIANPSGFFAALEEGRGRAKTTLKAATENAQFVKGILGRAGY